MWSTEEIKHFSLWCHLSYTGLKFIKSHNSPTPKYRIRWYVELYSHSLVLNLILIASSPLVMIQSYSAPYVSHNDVSSHPGTHHLRWQGQCGMRSLSNIFYTWLWDLDLRHLISHLSQLSHVLQWVIYRSLITHTVSVGHESSKYCICSKYMPKE